jgi:hypothetical protein
MPIKTFREGAIGISVWERDGKRGRYLELTMSRSYVSKDKAGYTACFRKDDLLSLQGLLTRAGQWMALQEEPGRSVGEGVVIADDLTSAVDERNGAA